MTVASVASRWWAHSAVVRGRAVAAGAAGMPLLMLALVACGAPPATSVAQDPGSGTDTSSATHSDASPWQIVGVASPYSAVGLQALLTGGAGRALPAGTAVTASCPPLPATSGATLHCTVSMGVTAVDYLVSPGEGGSFRAAPTVGVVRLDTLRAAVAATFAPDYASPSVDCGPGAVAVVHQDQELTCTVASGTRRGSAHVVITDDVGGFRVTP